MAIPSHWIDEWAAAKKALKAQLDHLDRDHVFPDMHWSAEQRRAFRDRLELSIAHFDELLQMAGING